MPIFERYFMRSQAILTVFLVMGTWYAFKDAGEHHTGIGAYDTAAFCCLFVGFMAFALITFLNMAQRKELGGKMAIDDGMMFSYGYLVLSAAISIEGMHALASKALVPGILLLVAAMVVASYASIWTFYVRTSMEKAYWQERGYWFLVGHHALVPLAMGMLMIFLASSPAASFRLSFVEDLTWFWCMAATLLVQYFWATELDHIASIPFLRVVSRAKEAA